MEATECGAAALGIILAYYGRYETLETLRVVCGVSRDGSKAINMLKAARQYGLHAVAGKVEDLDALSTLTFPLIVFWEFNHFIVLEGIQGDKFYINDPATGPRYVSREEFDRAFTGIILVFETTSDFKPAGKPVSVLASLKQRLGHTKLVLTLIIIASLALVVPGIIIPGFSKIFIDDILIRQMNSWLLPLLVGMLVTAALRGLLTWLQTRYLLRLQIKLALMASTRFFWHVLRLPILFFQQRYAGDINERVSANDRVANLLSANFTASAVGVITMIFFAIVMFFLDWQLTLIGIIAAFLNFSLLYAVSRKVADTNRRFLQDQGKLAGLEMNALQSIETLKAMGLENDFFRRWSGWHAKNINTQQSIVLYNQLLLIIPRLLTGLVTVAILGLGSWQIMQGYLTVGTLVAFQSLIVSFNTPLAGLLGFGSEMQKIRGDLLRLDDVLKHPEDPRLIETTEKADSTEQLSGHVEFKQVTFAYSKMEPPIIEDLNIEIKPGTRVALIGKTGSGKSTISKLLCGLYEPWSGEILLDGKKQEAILRSVFSRSVSLVDQDIFLFEGSVADNLSLWNKEVSEAEMRTALHHAQLEDVVAERGGLGAYVAEAGVNFSGGQRQRLEIARALINNPTLLILDEATASLDPVMEKRVYDSLKEMHCTLFIIAHRLSAIRDCDEIFVLDKGKVVERGTHDTLLTQNGLYKQLVVSE